MPRRTPDSQTAALPVDPGPDLPERFTVVARLGRGGFGDVWRAWDRVAQHEVALKVVRLAPGEHRRFHREVNAMAHLDIPGVARLLHFEIGERVAWLSMEIVDGGPFPGGPRPADWAWLEPRATALLVHLGALHAAGFVHRDLKPNNVLADAAGRVTILDFGLARGAAAGSTFTETGAVLGTPRYMAPEQCRGLRADARSDLYAVGVMLYEALSGGIPIESDGVQGLMRARAFTPAPPLGSRVRGLPWHVTAAIDALLALDPLRRPPTTDAALRLFHAGTQRPGPLPFLGDADAVRRDAARLRAGRGRLIQGPRGSGRTRWVTEVQACLGDDGWEVLVIPPGRRPYESLAAALEVDLTGTGVPAAVQASLATLTARRLVLVADGIEDLDRWSRRVIEDGIGELPILATAVPDGEPGAATLTREPPPRAEGSRGVAEGDPADRPERSLDPLTSGALEPLFSGTERFFHLPSDAAAALARRTGGLPAAVTAEIGDWVARGLATWVGEQLDVQRADLERIGLGAAAAPSVVGTGDDALEGLLHWLVRAPHLDTAALARARGEEPWALVLQLEALADCGAVREVGGIWQVQRPPGAPLDSDEARRIHAALADAWPIGHPDRHPHLLAAGRLEAAEAEAAPAATALVAAGRPAAAVALLEELANAGGTPRGEVAHSLAAAAWADRGADLRRRIRTLGARLGIDADAARLLDAAPGESIGDVPSDLPVQADPELEAFRRDLLITASARAGVDAWAGAVADGVAWAERTGHPDILARALGWQADLAYVRGHFADAAVLGEAAARHATRIGDTLGYLFRAASVRLEAGDVAQAQALATEVRSIAAERRLPLHEARGMAVLRALGERTGTIREVDLALVAAAHHLPDAGLAGVLVLTEARIAWRAGDGAGGAELARAAHALFAAASHRVGRLVTEALAFVCDPPSAGRAETAGRLLEEMDALGRPDVVVEVVGLLALAGALPSGDWIAQIEAAAARLPGYRRDWPHGAFSVEDVVRLLRAR